MADELTVCDLSPFEGLTAEDEVWLSQLQQHVRVSDHLIRLGEPEAEDEDYVVYRDAIGTWQAGRYIGELALGGRRLEIKPRLGEPVVEDWLGQAFNLIAVPESATRQHSRSFIARLMGAVWCRSVDQASRHGPPNIRREERLEGPFVRGRIDISRTAALRERGSSHLASRRSRRDLDNDVSRTLVVAERVLTQRIGHDQWDTPRVNEILPRLQEAVGVRPRLPRKTALRRIRYTPITRPFKATADLSWSIAQLQGFTATTEEGRCEGLLLDVAELWELFVLNCVRRAVPELAVEHGTRAGERTFLLQSKVADDVGLGRLLPDVLVRDRERVVAVLDAKYKRLRNHPPERPKGVAREDLYQLAAYLARYAQGRNALGALLYPRAPGQEEEADAKEQGPWRNEAGTEVRFERLAVKPEDAVGELTKLLT